MVDQDKAFTELKNELRTGFAILTGEVHTGLTGMSRQIEGTNRRIDETNKRIDKTNSSLGELTGCVEGLNGRVDVLTGHVDVLTGRVEGLNGRVDGTNERIDETNTRLGRFEKDVSKKLDGIGTYLRSINGSVLEHSQRIFKLERRVDDIEKGRGA